MSRRENRFNNMENKINFMVLGSIAFVIIIAFILSYVLYSNKLQRNAKAITNSTEMIASQPSNAINLINNHENVEEASSSIGKSVNELENQNTTTNTENTETTVKMAVNTSTVENVTVENTESETTEDNEQNEEEENEDETQTIVPQAISFAMPVDGEIVKEYSKDTLVYSNTLEEWTTHLGVDFAANKTEVVKAAADGVIKSIKNDPRYGLTIVIEHDGEFESIYSSLLSSEFVTVGENVEKGETIGTVGNTATFEIADSTHLHFELKKDGENVDPIIYLK